MGRNLIETVMGAVVLIVAGVFISFAWRTAEIRAENGYPLTARFAQVGGLERGADVRVNGIKVGTVSDVRLDPDSLDAVVSLTIRDPVALPTDTAVMIESDGLLGGKYVRLKPGQSSTTAAPGGELTATRDFRSLEDQIGEVIYLATSPAEPSLPRQGP